MCLQSLQHLNTYIEREEDDSYESIYPFLRALRVDGRLGTRTSIRTVLLILYRYFTGGKGSASEPLPSSDDRRRLLMSRQSTILLYSESYSGALETSKLSVGGVSSLPSSRASMYR